MRLKIIIILMTALLVLFLLLNPNAQYIANISYDQAKILLGAEDIDDVLKKKIVEKEIADQLDLVPEIMAFGDEIGFPKTKAYGKYSPLNRNVFYYSLSASKKDSFENYLWDWPFVGKLPYKGFIQLENAKKEELELKELGYDTHIGQSRAMSTLGFLPDPIIPTMIDNNDTTELMSAIFHERTHQLFFKKNEVDFNENAAVLIGTEASLEFLRKKFGPGSAEYRTQIKKLNDIIIFSNYIDDFYKDLNALYSENISSQEKISNREAIFQKHVELFRTEIKPQLKILFRDFDRSEMDNSYILSYYRYYGKVHFYIQAHVKLGSDLRKTLNFFREAANYKGESDQFIGNFISGRTDS